MNLFCCGCKKEVEAVLIRGALAYPHRKDLSCLPFWQCPICKSFVGCHHKTKNKLRPLGCIPSDEIKNARKHIHAKLDPIWQSGKISRCKLYKKISSILGYEFHTAEIRTIEEARRVWRVLIKEEWIRG